MTSTEISILYQTLTLHSLMQNRIYYLIAYNHYQRAHTSIKVVPFQLPHCKVQLCTPVILEKHDLQTPFHLITVANFFAGEDFEQQRFSVFIPPGVSSQLATVNITDDNIVEFDETFRLLLVSVSNCGVTIGNHNASEVIIADNDGMYVDSQVRNVCENTLFIYKGLK